MNIVQTNTYWKPIQNGEYQRVLIEEEWEDGTFMRMAVIRVPLRPEETRR